MFSLNMFNPTVLWTVTHMFAFEDFELRICYIDKV